MPITLSKLAERLAVVSHTIVPSTATTPARSIPSVTLSVNGTTKTVPVYSTPYLNRNNSTYELVAPLNDVLYGLGRMTDTPRYYIWSPAGTYNSTVRTDWNVTPGVDVGVYRTDDTSAQIQGTAGALTTSSQFFVDLTRPAAPTYWISSATTSKSFTSTDPLLRFNNWEAPIVYGEKQTPVTVADATVVVTPKTTANGFLQSLSAFTITSLNTVVDGKTLTALFDPAAPRPVGLKLIPAAQYGAYGISATYSGALYQYYVIPALDGLYNAGTLPVQIVQLVQSTGKGGLYYKSITLGELAVALGTDADLVTRSLTLNLAGLLGNSGGVYAAALDQLIGPELVIKSQVDNALGMSIAGLVTGIVGTVLGAGALGWDLYTHFMKS